MISTFLVQFSYHINIPSTFFCLVLIAFARNTTDNHGTLGGQDKIVSLSILCSSYMTVLYSLPLAASLLSWVIDLLSRQRKLSKLYDIDGKIIEPRCQRKNIPSLPDADYTSKEEWDKIYEKLKGCKKNSNTSYSKKEVNKEGLSWAMITGASRGIGRAIAIEIARLKVPLILVARNEERLEDLAALLHECYGVPTKVIACDFEQPSAAQNLYDETSEAKYIIDILINNAGITETAELITMDKCKIDQLTNVNVLTPTKLCQLYGRDMKERKRGRIVIMSSLTGAVPGVPTSAVYAATKSYQRSLATSLRKELEPHGVGVTCIMPGAVKDTNFASYGKMTDSFVWDFPLVTLTPDIVAFSSVKAMIVGYPEVVVGWLNTVLVKVMSFLLPARIIVMICECSWRPSPFRTNKAKEMKND